MAGRLTDRDHEAMDALLAEMADALIAGRLSKSAFVEAMAHVMTALDIGNRDEARYCFNAGAQHFEPFVAEPAAQTRVAPSAAPRLAGPCAKIGMSPLSSASIIVLSDRRHGASRPRPSGH